MTIQILKPDKINSFLSFLKVWDFKLIPCQSIIEYLKNHGITKPVRRRDKFILYAKRYDSRMMPSTEYWLVVDNVLYHREAIPYGGMTKDMIKDLEKVL